jgi:hypothetical protein
LASKKRNLVREIIHVRYFIHNPNTNIGTNA